jgi:hypothetical protein
LNALEGGEHQERIEERRPALRRIFAGKKALEPEPFKPTFGKAH